MSNSDGATLKALVYTGPAACRGCPEAVRDLLNNHPTYNIHAIIAGPRQDTNIDADSLQDVSILAFPGGPDLDSAWKSLKSHSDDIRSWVQNGGHYLGFCLGAFLAGGSPGFNLLPAGGGAVREVLRAQAQVANSNDAMLQVNWTWQTGNMTGQTEDNRWVYFQDGTSFNVAPNSTSKVIGKYSANNDVAAMINTFGNGSVGVIGFHPEAQQSWYNQDGFTNPQGIKFDIGYDFISATLGNKTNGSSTPNVTPSTSPSPSKGSASSIDAMPQMALLLVALSWVRALFS